MKIGEAIKLYREYCKTSTKEFAIDAFIAEDDVKEIEEKNDNPSIGIDNLLKLYQYFSNVIFGHHDARKIQIRAKIAHMIMEEIRRRAENNENN